MPIEIRIDDNDLVGFSDPAKERIKAAGEEYINSIISESNRLESDVNTGSGPVEITQGIVNDALVFQRRTTSPRKLGVYDRIVRISSAVLPLFVGFLYDATKLQDPGYLGGFIVLIALAIIAITLSVSKE